MPHLMEAHAGLHCLYVSPFITFPLRNGLRTIALTLWLAVSFADNSLDRAQVKRSYKGLIFFMFQRKTISPLF